MEKNLPLQALIQRKPSPTPAHRSLQRALALPAPKYQRLHSTPDPQLSPKTPWLCDTLKCSYLAAARLKLAAPLFGKRGALPGRKATAGPWRGRGGLVPLSIAVTVSGEFLSVAQLPACSNTASPQMSGVLKRRQQGGGGRARCWLRNSPQPRAESL